MTIVFSFPFPSTEWERLDEIGAPITLPCLKYLRFGGLGAYLESLIAQIRVPLLDRLTIDLCDQIAFAPPHLFRMVNITKVFNFSSAMVMFRLYEVFVYMEHDHGIVQVSVGSLALQEQIEVAARIYDALIPTLSDVEKLSLFFYQQELPRHIWAENATWHDFLRRFIGVKLICTDNALFDELSYALQVDEVRSDPGFLPNLQNVDAKDKSLTTRRVVGSPVQFLSE